MSEHKPTIEGSRLIKDWLDALESVERRRQALNSAECEVMNTANALSKWMLPDDAKPGEKIAFWFGDSLIQVECPVEHGRDPKLTVRTRGDRHDNLRVA